MIQRELCRWIRLAYPGVIFNSDLSGLNMHGGIRGRVASLRSSRGVPDLMVFEPSYRRGYTGLFVELKSEGVKIRKLNGEMVKDSHINEQRDMMEMLRGKGYFANFAVGLDEAMELVEWYLEDKIMALPIPDYIDSQRYMDYMNKRTNK